MICLLVCQPSWSHLLGWVDKGLNGAGEKKKEDGLNDQMCV